jgi:hypothetical protein
MYEKPPAETLVVFFCTPHDRSCRGCPLAKTQQEIHDTMNCMKKKKTAKRFLDDSANRLYAGAGLVLVASLFLAGYFLVTYLSVQPDERPRTIGTNEVEAERPCEMRRALDGVCVDREDDVQTEVVAVMVENKIEAQPLSGIAAASVVYEAPVEGNIPRLLVLFPLESQGDKVGPVRSARPYYLDWVHEYPGAMYMHVGGSPDALARIESEPIFDINEFSRGWYFWRSSDRFAPHNTYTSYQLWQKAFDDYSHTRSGGDREVTSWQFETIPACEENCGATDIRVTYGGGTYTPRWIYDKETQQYVRSEYGRTDRDQDGSVIVADTVIVQFADVQVIDDVGRLSMKTTGTGDAVVFHGGHAFEGEWHKTRLNERTSWFDAQGEPLPVRPGKIWIQIVSQFDSAQWK